MLFQKNAHERRAAAVERAGGASCSRGEVNPADAAQQAVRKGCPRVIEQGRQRASRKASAFGGGSGKRIASVRKVEAACVPPTFSASRCFRKVSALVTPTRAYPKLNAYFLSRLVKGMMPFRLEPFPAHTRKRLRMASENTPGSGCRLPCGSVFRTEPPAFPGKRRTGIRYV